MGNVNTIPKHILKKKKTINFNQSYKKEQKLNQKRERDRVLAIFVQEKYGLNRENDIKFMV